MTGAVVDLDRNGFPLPAGTAREKAMHVVEVGGPESMAVKDLQTAAGIGGVILKQPARMPLAIFEDNLFRPLSRRWRR